MSYVSFSNKLLPSGWIALAEIGCSNLVRFNQAFTDTFESLSYSHIFSVLDLAQFVLCADFACKSVPLPSAFSFPYQPHRVDCYHELGECRLFGWHPALSWPWSRLWDVSSRHSRTNVLAPDLDSVEEIALNNPYVGPHRCPIHMRPHRCCSTITFTWYEWVFCLRCCPFDICWFILIQLGVWLLWVLVATLNLELGISTILGYF